mmetsp:Transcript_10559/g.30071  ORF Transcript_10559/g.30071 Transcript_10559/m.30071 type:complete len:236 (+) Transcript_10559:146-853(+)
MAFLQRLAFLAVLAAVGVSYGRKRLAELPRESAYGGTMIGEHRTMHNQMDESGSAFAFLVRGSETDGARMVVMEVCQPGSPVVFETGKPCSPPYHFHTSQVETFEILSGVFTYRADGSEPKEARPGDTVVVPMGVAHQFWNNHSKPLSLKVTLEPALTGEVFFENCWGLYRQGYASPMQMLTLLFDHGITLANVPEPVNLGIQHILVPFAKLLGYKSMYPEYTSGESMATLAAMA